MIGIDVIDLNDASLRTREKSSFRFILHPEDQYNQAYHTFWHLWTAKEAVFKAKRIVEAFAPKKIPICIFSRGNQFAFNSGPFYGSYIQDQDKIMAVCAHTQARKFEHGLYPVTTSSNSSGEIRTRLKEYCNEKFSQQVVVVNDQNGLPIMNHNGSVVSFTHHGSFCAWAFVSA